MNLIQKILKRIHYCNHQFNVESEPQMIVQGWDNYAKDWQPDKFSVVPGYRVQYLGDEWTAEDVSAGGTTYDLAPEILAHFDDYITKQLLDPYLPSCASEGLEIGPGGGRLTALLIPRTNLLHLAEPSKAMLRHLKQRFSDAHNLRYYSTDGMTLPELHPASLDYTITFDVFVHFEPRLIYWYLRQIERFLKPGGIGIIHYANVLSSMGWQQFEMDLNVNVLCRSDFASFGVMCPQLMMKFLQVLKLEVISSDVGVIPRDALAVFKKPLKNGG